MITWFVPENTWIVAVIGAVVALIIGLIVRRKNIEYLKILLVF